jgi:UDP-glucose 4-epimerase
MTTVWITGAKGFIGRHLSAYLAAQGHVVAGLGHGAWPLEIAATQGLTHWINGDIDAHNLQQLLQRSGQPQVIYHLAGGSSVGLSLQTPAEDFRRSVVSTSALLEWIRVATPETKLVVSSSAAIYGDTGLDRIPETGQYTPYSPYGFHKRSAELMCESYAQTFGIQVAIVRLFSVYGPGLCKQLLWDLCGRLTRSPQVLELHGTGAEIRDWLYVTDAISLLVAASDVANTHPLILNGATGVGTSVNDVAKLLCKILNQSPEIKFSGQQRSGDPFSLVGDTGLRQQMLNIQLDYPLHLGLTEYVHWFQYFQAHGSASS